MEMFVCGTVFGVILAWAVGAIVVTVIGPPKWFTDAEAEGNKFREEMKGKRLVLPRGGSATSKPRADEVK